MLVSTEIAKIRRARICWEGHGILTCMVDLDYGSSAQGCGGYSLDEPQHDDEGHFTGRVGTAYGMEWIARLMRAAGVDSFEKVEGRTVLVVRDGDGYNARVIGLKPLPMEPGEAFIFNDLAVEFFPEVAL